MQHSRYLWLTGVVLLSFFLILTFNTPQVVMTAMTDPFYANSPQVTIQNLEFSGLKTGRSGQGLITNEETQIKGIDLVYEWEMIVKDDALLKLLK